MAPAGTAILGYILHLIKNFSCNAGGLSHMDQIHTVEGRKNFLTSLRFYNRKSENQRNVKYNSLSENEEILNYPELEVTKNRQAYVNYPVRNGRELQKFHR